MPIAISGALLILPDGPREGVLRFDRKQILSIDQPARRRDRHIALPNRVIYPGLINAHDHLELNHYPRTKFRSMYASAHDWGEDFLPALETEPFATLRKMPLEGQCNIGGLKNLRSGVTTVAHHNPLHRPLTHPDFPVRVVRHYGWAHSLHFASEVDIQRSFRRTRRQFPWMIHVAEGADARAQGELTRLESLGCLRDNTVLIHGVGLTGADRKKAIRIGAGLVWCPSTNLFLLGKTGQIGDFSHARMLALGTDSRLTADGDMLDELRAANATGQIDPIALIRAVTTDAARILRLQHVGALRAGYVPDFLIAQPKASGGDPYSDLIALTRPEIEAVIIGGRVRHGQIADLTH